MSLKTGTPKSSTLLVGEGELVARGEIVVYYRLYLLGEANGRFIGFEEIEADDDGEALRRAERFRGDHPLELWCGSRKVCSIPPLTANA